MLILDIKTGAESTADPLQLIAYGEGYMAYKELGSAQDMVFDENSHTYRLRGGQWLPSVTQCTKHLINTEFFAPGSAELGSFRHKCCEYWDTGVLDYNGLNSDHLPYVDAWYDFLCHYGLQGVEVLIEEMFYHPKYLYSGRIDRIYPDYARGELLLWNVYLKGNGKFRVKSRFKAKDEEGKQIAFNDFLVLKRTTDMQIEAGKNLLRVLNTETPKKLIIDLTEVIRLLDSPYLQKEIEKLIEALKKNEEEVIL